MGVQRILAHVYAGHRSALSASRDYSYLEGRGTMACRLSTQSQTRPPYDPKLASGIKSGQHRFTPKEHLANEEQIMYIFLHLVAAAWMTATTVLPVRQFRS
jgi:hypothetical protein